MSSSTITRISTDLASYSRGMRAVGEVVIANPERVLCMSLMELARMAEVSEPTILRFCRQLGFSGYKEFKHRLAEELAADGLSRRFEADVQESDEGSLRSMISWRRGEFDSLVDMLDDEQFDRAVRVLAQARRIVFWGRGSSRILAQDACDTFRQAGIEGILSRSAQGIEGVSDVEDLAEGDAVMAFSRSGYDAELARDMLRARELLIPVVGLSVADTPVTRSSTVSLTLRRPNPQNFRSEMCLWMAQYFVIDALTVATAIRRER